MGPMRASVPQFGNIDCFSDCSYWTGNGQDAGLCRGERLTKRSRGDSGWRYLNRITDVSLDTDTR